MHDRIIEGARRLLPRARSLQLGSLGRNVDEHEGVYLYVSRYEGDVLRVHVEEVVGDVPTRMVRLYRDARNLEIRELYGTSGSSRHCESSFDRVSNSASFRTDDGHIVVCVGLTPRCLGIAFAAATICQVGLGGRAGWWRGLCGKNAFMGELGFLANPSPGGG